jgi:hypothetical protein
LVGRVHLCRPQKQPVERKRRERPVHWTRPCLLIALINPQIALDTQHNLIVTHEVTNTGSESRNVRLNPARILSLHVVLNLHLGHGMLASAMRSMNSSRFPAFCRLGLKTTEEVFSMCDYSLHHVKSRPAKVGDKLTTRDFNTGTRGFAAPENPNMAVCVLPRTELAFARAISCRPRGVFGWNDSHLPPSQQRQSANSS